MPAGWVYDCLQCSALLMLKFPHSGLIYLAVRPDLGETEEWAVFTLLNLYQANLYQIVSFRSLLLYGHSKVWLGVEYFPN